MRDSCPWKREGVAHQKDSIAVSYEGVSSDFAHCYGVVASDHNTFWVTNLQPGKSDYSGPSP